MHKNRSRAFERNQRERAIHRKKRIAREVFGCDLYNGVDGKYNKAHLGCGCGICKPGRKWDLPTWRDTKEKTKFLQDLDDSMEDWEVNDDESDQQ